MAPISLPRPWSRTLTPLGIELTFRAQRATAAVAAGLLVAAALLFCLWQIWGFLKNWFIDRAEILPGGVVFFLLLCGGALLCVKGFRQVFRSVTYRLLCDRLEVVCNGASKLTIEKSRVKKLIQLYTPPKEPPLNGTWVTCLVHTGTNGKDQEFFFEGDAEEESAMLIRALKEWAPLEVEKQETSD